VKAMSETIEHKRNMQRKKKKKEKKEGIEGKLKKPILSKLS
jgi:hypothetical protein